MFKSRLFNVLMIAALIAVMALTVLQAVETTRVAHAAQQSKLANTPLCAMPAAPIQSTYVKQMGIWVPRSANAPTGVDGGLIQILSDYRSCSN
jgi:hypothetical protein